MTRSALAATVLAAFTALTLTACGGGDQPQDPRKLDDAAQLACDDFAAWAQDGQPADTRTDTVRQVNGNALKSRTNGIAKRGRGLANTVDANPSAQQLANDAFAQACFDAGWKE